MELDSEAQKVILPKDLFRSQFTWSCYEICKHRRPWVVSGLCLSLVWGMLGFAMLGFDVNGKYAYLYYAIAELLLALTFICPLRSFIHHRHLPNARELSQQVLELNPGLDIDKWELVASTSNAIFYQKQIWGTPYFFFDGKHALNLFRSSILKLYLEGKFGRNDMDEIGASKIYLQSVREEFEYGLKENLPELVSEFELPRDTGKSRFFSNSQYWFSIFMICFLQVEYLFPLLSSEHRTSPSDCVLILWDFYGSALIWSDLKHVVYPTMSTLQELKFLVVITKVAPGKDLDKWDEIARYVNQYLADGEAHNSGKFFDGKHCLGLYTNFFEPLSTGNGRLEAGDLTEIVQITRQYVD